MKQKKVKTKFVKSKKDQFWVVFSGSTISGTDPSEMIFNERHPESSKVEGIRFYNLEETILGFEKLKYNWDSYQAEPVSQTAVAISLQVLNELRKNRVLSESICVNVFPMRDAGIQFEFDDDNFSAELEINSQGEMKYILFDNESSKVSETPIYGYELSELSNLLEESIYATK